jgi:hypothetical protein
MARAYPSPVTIAHKFSTARTAQSVEKRELFRPEARPRHAGEHRPLDIRFSRAYFTEQEQGFARPRPRHPLLLHADGGELTVQQRISKPSFEWRRGREAEGGGLLNRYTVKSRIEGSNPSVSASRLSMGAGAPALGSLAFLVTMRP